MFVISALLLIVLTLAACGGDAESDAAVPASNGRAPVAAATEAAATVAEPTATTATSATAATAAPVGLVDIDLLHTPGVVTQCDAGGAQPAADLLQCRELATGPNSAVPHLAVAIDAGSYARWSLRWEPVPAPLTGAELTGTETLALTLTPTGDLQPNLYFVEENGDRLHVSLARYGLEPDAGTQTIFVPLREIQDDAGNRPDFAAVNEVQLVFEWAEMAGEVTLHGLRFARVWTEPVAPGDAPGDRAYTLAQGLEVPPGFGVTPVAAGLLQMTQMDVTPAGDLLVSLQGGRVWWYRDADGDGSYEQRHLYTTGFTEIVGLLYEPAGEPTSEPAGDPIDGAVWLGGRGQLYRTRDTTGDGVADEFDLRLDGLPWGRHQNNGLAWNPAPDPFSGEPQHTWIYFGLGSTGDLEAGGPHNAAVVRFPRTGTGIDDLEIVAHGVRNAYNVHFAPVPVDPAAPDGAHAWQLFAGENGPDFSGEPDEVNHIRWGRHYGFPDQFGPVEPSESAAEGDPYSGPVYAVTPHASANGLAYITNPAWPAEYRTLYLSLFGEVFSPTPVGHTVERIALETITLPDGTHTYRGTPHDFVVGLDRPLPLAIDAQGDLLVGDYATGVIYRIFYAGDNDADFTSEMISPQK